MQAGNITARLGGDTFVTLLSPLDPNRDTAVKAVRQRALKIRTTLNEPIQIMAHSLVVTCSIGVVFFPNDADTSEQLLKLADAALHQAKQEGRD